MEERTNSYKAQLRSDVELFLDSQAEQVTADELFTFVYEVALQSWKNGLSAGRRRAGRASGGDTASREQKSTPRPRSALAAGRLTRKQ